MDFKGFLSLVFLFSFDVVSGCVGRKAPTTIWDVNNYPNPQKEPEKCGRNVTSFLCDPDGLLTRIQASDLDNLLQEVSSSGPCLCEDTCTEKTGINIFIALLARLKSSDGDAKLSDLEAFTTGLKDVSWNFDACEDDLYIAVSDYDMMVYVRTGSQTQKFINDECIKEVIRDTKPMLCNGDYYNLLHDMIIQYKNMASASVDRSTARCKTEVSASNTLKIVLLVVFVGLPATTFLVIFSIFFCPVFCKTLPCNGGYSSGPCCDIDCDPCCCCRLCESKDKYIASTSYSTGRSGASKRSGVDSPTNRDWSSNSGGGYTGGNTSSDTSHHIDFGGSDGGGGGGGEGGGGGGDCC